ncbi:MAG: AraC family transcriptional regulator [Lachnospiraceae bacterium]|nr:AraC family transcriptional regulator [Lachnospiraceae bacterium]
MRQSKKIIEYRSYELPMEFPVLLLTGDQWHISDVPSGRLHFHNCMEIGICHSDDGYMEFDEGKHPFRAGDMTVFSRNIPHTTCSSPGKASLWSYLFLAPEELLQGYFGDAAPQARLYREMLEEAHMILHSQDEPALWQMTRQIMWEMKEKPVNYQFSVVGLVLSFMMQLLRIYSRQRPTGDKTLRRGGDGVAQNALVIAPALDYIRYHYMQNFPMEILAEKCFLSQTHFRRIFHEIMETSPLEYLNRTRILQSCVLLRMTEDSILSVSECVGFRSISSFNRHFIEVMKVTPSEWRRSMAPLERVSILRYTGWLQAQIPEH